MKIKVNTVLYHYCVYLDFHCIRRYSICWKFISVHQFLKFTYFLFYSDHMTKKGFVRLNSMESMSSTTSSNASTNSNSHSVGVKSDLEKTLYPNTKTPMSAKESKWFGKYQNDYQYHQYQPHYWNNQHLNSHQKWNTNQHSQHNQYFGEFENSKFLGHIFSN